MSSAEFEEWKFKNWKDKLTLLDIDKIIELEYRRKYSVKKYFDSEKGRKKRQELNKKYYEQRKAMKELGECC